ncbi:type II toxin-antitoxin system Phd/YefM family antitoxin [Sphingomonas sp.]|uniref:type II toxin-antitoxin system Phd/YefM family antitoxin n=1 Tax=Sphingomonas sp. TaxID=28214 RepID=UPI0035BC62B7
MKHVPIAEFKDRLSEFVAAVESGEEVTITRHGRDVARLVSPQVDEIAERRRVLADMAEFRAGLHTDGVRITRSDVLGWIAEGRNRNDDRH